MRHSINLSGSTSTGSLLVLVPPSSTQLTALTGTFALAESAAVSTLAGLISGRTLGSTITLSDTKNNRLEISGSSVVRGSKAIEYDLVTYGSGANRYYTTNLIENLPGASNNPLVTPIVITVPAPTPMIAPLANWSGGRDAGLGIPDAYWTAIYDQLQDTNTHPGLGPATHTAVKSGNWSDPTVWDVGTVPGGTHLANISGTNVVDFDVVMSTGGYSSITEMLAAYRNACNVLAGSPSDVDALAVVSACQALSLRGIHVGGTATLNIKPDVQTLMIIDSEVVHGGLICGTDADPIRYPFADSTPGHHCVFLGTGDPGATTKLGLMTMGKLRMRGEDKTAFTKFAVAPAQGNTWVTLDTIPTNWRIGDTIVITSTTFAGRSTTDSTYTGPLTACVPGPIRIMDAWYPGTTAIVNGSPANPAGVMVQDNADNFKLSNDEVRVIAGITGNIVSFSTPLAYNHLPHTGNLPDGTPTIIEARCTNWSRSIRFEGAYVREKGITGTGCHRAHTMHMHHDDGLRRHVEFRNMGRSRIDPSLTSPENGGYSYQNPGDHRVNNTGAVVIGILDHAGGSLINDPMNVRGRYAVHDHWCGPFTGRRAIISDDLAIWSEPQFAPTPGWAYTQHHSRSHLNKVMTFNTRGSGIASELGTETGQWINCLSIWNRSDGYDVQPGGIQSTGVGGRQEYISNHNGHCGNGFENQSREILMQGCIAISSKYGFMYFQQRTHPISARSPYDTELRYADPLVKGMGPNAASAIDFFDATVTSVYGNQQVQIREWHDNEAHDCDIGFYVAHRDFLNENDVMPMLSRGFKALSEVRPFFIPHYTFNYFFKDMFLKGKGNGVTSYGIDIGTKAYNLNFKNVRVDAVTYALNHLEFNYNGFWVDFNGTYGSFHKPDTVGQPIDYNTLAAHPQNGIMGPWSLVSTSGSTGKVIPRDLSAPLTSADMPQPYPISPFVLSTVEPSPGTPKPYFYSDNASTTAVTPTGVGQVQVRGRIIDSWGIRSWPSWHRFLSGNPIDPINSNHSNVIATGTDLVIRNGCWKDVSNNWFMTMWFTDADRGTHQYLQWSHTVPLSGFDPAFLALYQVANANATKPVLPIVKENLVVNETPSIQTTVVLSGVFTAVTGAARSSTSISNSVTVQRLTAGQTVNVSVSGGQYSKNGGAPSSTATTVKNGDTLALVNTNSSSGSITTTSTLTVGTKSLSFSSTTV